MKINNRRYTGSKYKLMDWIKKNLNNECKECKSFMDIFAGTGVVSAELLENYDKIIINDFLYSNNIIYKGFFAKGNYNKSKLETIKNKYQFLNADEIEDNYYSDNYGGKYFSYDDAKKIGFIRDDIDKLLINKKINKKEFNILLASLLYSFDRIANTVGHYEAYIKGKTVKPAFLFDLIEPYKTSKEIKIYQMDANQLARKEKADIVFIDPPYNSRQYSRFYHVMETITKNDKPKLYGVAMKPKEENMSEYCRNSAAVVLKDLVDNLDCKYIALTYNNCYNSKSTSSQNKISFDQIKKILESKGETKIFEHKHNAFNAGKTDLKDNKEYLFITKVNNSKKTNEEIIRSPLFYVGDKYKLMPQLKEIFPDNIDNYIEPFVGGGSSFLNTKAKRYYLNDNNEWIIKIHKELQKYNKKELLSKLYSIIDEYSLSCSFKGTRLAPKELKKSFPKTYYAKLNSEGYNKLRDDFNKDKEDVLKLYILLLYGFNHMIRFNSKNNFNLPVGDVDFNKNCFNAINDYLDFCNDKDIFFYNQDYEKFLNEIDLSKKNTFVYLDPPYLISSSEYNKFWTEKEERNLYSLLDKLNDKGIKFGLTNLITHKGQTNEILLEWSKKYKIYNIRSNYISFNDNSIKADSSEILVVNYDKTNEV